MFDAQSTSTGVSLIRLLCALVWLIELMVCETRGPADGRNRVVNVTAPRRRRDLHLNTRPLSFCPGHGFDSTPALVSPRVHWPHRSVWLIHMTCSSVHMCVCVSVFSQCVNLLYSRKQTSSPSFKNVFLNTSQMLK